MSVGTETVSTEATPFSGKTAWARNLAAPVRSFLSTEEGGAFVMLGAAIAALLWANSPWWHSYEKVWTTQLAITIGSHGIAADLRGWVNQGLMTLFFLVVGLEAKRQLDLGELRDRRRLAIPVFAAMGGILIPVLIYLAFNAGRTGGHGWGAAMSTDTAFALAAVALVTPRTATRIRVFLLTLAVVDDLAALVVIATVYTTHVSVVALAIAVGLFGVLIALRYAPWGRAPISVGVAVAIWVAMFKSGIDPVIAGLAIGLGTSAYPPGREDLERATALARSFRRATHAGARPLGGAELRFGDLAQRTRPVRAAPLDELRDRPAVRAGERGDPHHGRIAERRGLLADHAGASCSVTSSASRSACSPAHGSRHAPRCTGRAPRSAGRCSWPPARARASASRCRCSSRPSRSMAERSTRRGSGRCPRS